MGISYTRQNIRNISHIYDFVQVRTVCMYVCLYVPIFVCTYIRTYVCIHVGMDVCINMYACKYE